LAPGVNVYHYKITKETTMQEIKTVAVIGAGAMGAIYATHFYHTPGFSPVFIARDQRLEKLQKDGIIVNGSPYFIPAIRPEDASSPADLIIVSLKHHQLEEGIRDLGSLVGSSTVFLSVMNGLESEETIAALYGKEKVLYAVSFKVDAVRSDNQITYTRPGIIYFGEAQNKTLSANVQRVQRAFDQAGLSYETPEDMLRMLWWKFLFNVGINQASAVLRAPYGLFQSNREAQELMEALMEEVVVLAQRLAINLTAEDIQGWYPVLHALSPQGKTSMLQDIEAQRKTEVDIFGGKVIALGKANGIPTPVNQTVVRIIRAMEQTAG
jgi:2-dehydropantoate 2-reductase